MSNPYQSPIADHSHDRGSLPLWENAVAVAVALLAAAYAVVCIASIVSINSIDNLINRTVAGDNPSDASITAAVQLNHHLNTAVQALFWVMYLAFIAWMLSLNSRFRSAGRGSAMRRLTAWKVWRVGVIVSLLLVIVLQSHDSTVDSASTALSEDHRQIGYLAVRAAIGCLYVWVALSMRIAARSLYAPTSTAQPTWPVVDGGPASTI